MRCVCSSLKSNALQVLKRTIAVSRVKEIDIFADRIVEQLLQLCIHLLLITPEHRHFSL